MAFTFRLLGPLEVRRDGQPITFPSARHRALVAALLADANQLVPTGVLATRIWGADIPDGALGTVPTYVHRIRHIAGTPDVITTRPDGYLIEVSDDALDVLRFRSLLRRARATPDAHEQATLLREALAQWHGEPLSDVQSPPLHREFVPTLLEERLTALELRFDADLRRGLHTELVDELYAATGTHPLHEPFWSQLVRALHRAGRQREATDAYRTIRTKLVDELGIEPGPQLQAASRELLPRRPIPRQLPAPTSRFVGRTPELAALDAPGVTVCVIDGTAGVGKTTLAVQWAHQATDRFPDGQLYADLRGFAPTADPARPGDSLRGFLGALDIPAERIPATLGEQVDLYRTLMATRQTLVLLDNARDAEQVMPLLPGTPGCQVVITSRNRLDGLGARSVTLDLLDTDEAVTLLTRFVGPDRIAAEPDAVTDLITGCAHLPLALSIVAAQAALNPRFPLRALADDLLDDMDADVRTVFSWSYARLSSPAARMFRLTGLHPGTSFTVSAAASLAGVPPDEARTALTELTTAHLLDEPEPGRFTSHDLLHAYAAAQVGSTERHPAIRRLVDHYLVTAYRAVRLLNPLRDELTLPACAPGVTVDEHADDKHAWQWFEREEHLLTDVTALAVDTGFDTHAWQLPWVTATYLGRLARWHTFVAQQEIGLAAARRLGDQDAQVRLHHMIGHGSAELRAFDKAQAHLEAATELARELGDLAGEARAYRGLSLIAEIQEHFAEALAHSRSALALYEAAGHRAGQAGTLNAVGMFLGKLGRHEEALRQCEQALALLQELGERAGEANTWDSIGQIHHQFGHTSDAIAAYRAALGLFEQVGEKYEYAATVGRLGDAFLAGDDRAGAHSAYEMAAAALTELNHPEADAMRQKARATT